MEYFKIEEFIKSDTAKTLNIDNTPNEEIKAHIVSLVEELLDPLRWAWTLYCKGKGYMMCGLKITSGYRCKKLNKAVGGVPNSAHLTGYAADIVPLNLETAEFIRFAQKWCKDKKFDQCINEHNKWLHISLKNEGGEQRKQIFKL